MFSTLNVVTMTTRRRTLHRSIPQALAALLGLFAVTHHLFAATLSFPEHHFSIETPADWTQIQPPPTGTLAVAKTPDGATQMMVMARPATGPDLTAALKGFIAEKKKTLASQGWILEPDREVTLANHAFTIVVGSTAKHAPIVKNYFTATDTELIHLGFVTMGSGPSPEAQIDATVQSFHVLTSNALPSIALHLPHLTPVQISGVIFVVLLLGNGLLRRSLNRRQ